MANEWANRCNGPYIGDNRTPLIVEIHRNRHLAQKHGNASRQRTGLSSLRETILSALDQRKEWSEVPRLALRLFAPRHPEAKLIDTLTYATVREDLDFHNLQVLEVGFTQAEEWPTDQRRPGSTLVSSFWKSSRKTTGTAVQSRCCCSAGIERASFRAH